MTNVTCAIIYFGNKILATQRSCTMKLPLKWEFPGGKIENNETDTQCIIREIKEEINIEIEVVGRLSNNIHDYGNIKINLIPFIAKHVSGNIVLTEHSNYKLLDIDELNSLDWADADIPILNELINIKL
jgi:8-oxo-dGTP diphosphatase